MVNLLDQATDGFPDAEAVLTPAQRSLARRVRCLKAAEDRHLERMGLQRPPRVPSRVRATA